MARILRHWLSDPHGCAYLPVQTAALEYRLMLDVSDEELDWLLARGWRRFGPAYFRPGCRPCHECVPLRIPVASFRASKQQRRVWSKAKHLRLEVGFPQIDEQRLDLYHRWHAVRGETRGWPEDRLDAEEYYHQFAFPHPAVREYSYWDDAPPSGASPRLVGVGIVDETPRALSAVYTFHDPDYHRLSLGTASVLFQLAEAERLGKEWLYLGYRVRGCPSSEYKERFQPHELLTGRPGFDEEPRWSPHEGRWSEETREPAPPRSALIVLP